MALIKWEPFDDLDRIFSDFPGFSREGDISVDLYEEGDNYIAEMNVPGVKPEELEVTVEEGYLHVSGSRESTEEKKDKQYYSKEIRRGSFERVVRLPQTVQADNVSAEYENGVLKVTLPKTEGKEKSNKVEISVK